MKNDNILSGSFSNGAPIYSFARQETNIKTERRKKLKQTYRMNTEKRETEQC